jgi:phospholipase/carboxylesterase
VSLVIETPIPGPHGGARIVTQGRPPGEARAGVVLCHGRGGTAEDILALAAELEGEDLFWVAPQADEQTWYPYPFMAPLRDNEPHLSSALALMDGIVHALARAGIPAERQVRLGFSQGGCLALESAGRSARRYGGVVGLSAGLVGPPGRSWNFTGALGGTPVFLGCSDRDPHIPRDRVEESARELARIGGDVDLRIYRDLGHTVNRDELDRVQNLLDRIVRD